MRIIFLIYIITTGFIASGQYFAWGANKIPVYSQAFVPSEIKEIPIDTIYESARISECSDLADWQNFSQYTLKIIESKGTRHKILYHLDPSCEKGCSYNENDSIFLDKEGWVEKNNIVVSIKPRNNKSEFRLYQHYTNEIPFFKFQMATIGDNINRISAETDLIFSEVFSEELPVLEIGPDNWLKVLFMNRGEAHEGWTKDYCGSKDGCYGETIIYEY